MTMAMMIGPEYTGQAWLIDPVDLSVSEVFVVLNDSLAVTAAAEKGHRNKRHLRKYFHHTERDAKRYAVTMANQRILSAKTNYRIALEKKDEVAKALAEWRGRPESPWFPVASFGEGKYEVQTQKNGHYRLLRHGEVTPWEVDNSLMAAVRDIAELRGEAEKNALGREKAKAEYLDRRGAIGVLGEHALAGWFRDSHSWRKKPNTQDFRSGGRVDLDGAWSAILPCGCVVEGHADGQLAGMRAVEDDLLEACGCAGSP